MRFGDSGYLKTDLHDYIVSSSAGMIVSKRGKRGALFSSSILAGGGPL
jgi:hypothetical protein